MPTYAFKGRNRMNEVVTGERVADNREGLRQLLRNRALVLLSVGSSFRTMTQTALLTFLPVYLAHDMSYSPAMVGACLFALQAAGFAAAPVAGHLSDRMGRRRIMITSMLMPERPAVFSI